MPRNPLAPAILATFAMLAACSGQSKDAAPPRVNTPVEIKQSPSLITVPVEVGLSELSAALDRQVPKRLWSIDRPDQICVASKGVDLGIATVKTPKLRCHITGTVMRGPMRLSGQGETLRLAIPLHAIVHAENIGGVIDETATADAMAHAVIHINLQKDWTPRGTVDIRYDWSDAPHVDILGQRIEFAEEADRKLKPIVAKLERELPGHLNKLAVRRRVDAAWRSAFTVLSLNRQNPPVWMRITPQQLQYGGYEVAGNKLRILLGMKALTETFVGDKPEPSPPTALPVMVPLKGNAGRMVFFIPVIADYRQLEPVLMKALRKRSARSFDVPGVGAVRALFKGATIYGTTGGRIAVGVTFAANRIAVGGKPTNGTVWLTGLPVNRENSHEVRIADVAVSGTTDMTGGDLILKLANAPGVAQFIADSLEQNFESDFEDLLKKVELAIANEREGDFAIQAKIINIRTGKISASGQGLLLPTRIEGTATVALR